MVTQKAVIWGQGKSEISYYISVDDLIHLHLFFYNDKDRWPDVIGIGTH